MSNYDVNNKKIETILSWINEGIIAIPEIQDLSFGIVQKLGI